MNPKGAGGGRVRPRGRTGVAAARGGQAASLSIRPATPDDIPLVLQLIRELAIYEKLRGEVEATEAGLRRTLFPAGGAPPDAHVLIGEVGGKPAGFAVYFFNYSTFLAAPGLYLEDLFVRPESRGNGLGKALFLHLARIAVARGCGRMQWSVLDWNKPAMEFYRRMGAFPLEEWTVFRITGEALGGLVRRGGPRT